MRVRVREVIEIQGGDGDTESITSAAPNNPKISHQM